MFFLYIVSDKSPNKRLNWQWIKMNNNEQIEKNIPLNQHNGNISEYNHVSNGIQSFKKGDIIGVANRNIENDQEIWICRINEFKIDLQKQKPMIQISWFWTQHQLKMYHSKVIDKMIKENNLKIETNEIIFGIQKFSKQCTGYVEITDIKRKIFVINDDDASTINDLCDGNLIFKCNHQVNIDTMKISPFIVDLDHKQEVAKYIQQIKNMNEQINKNRTTNNNNNNNNNNNDNNNNNYNTNIN